MTVDGSSTLVRLMSSALETKVSVKQQRADDNKSSNWNNYMYMYKQNIKTAGLTLSASSIHWSILSSSSTPTPITALLQKKSVEHELIQAAHDMIMT